MFPTRRWFASATRTSRDYSRRTRRWRTPRHRSTRSRSIRRRPRSRPCESRTRSSARPDRSSSSRRRHSTAMTTATATNAPVVDSPPRARTANRSRPSFARSSTSSRTTPRPPFASRRATWTRRRRNTRSSPTRAPRRNTPAHRPTCTARDPRDSSRSARPRARAPPARPRARPRARTRAPPSSASTARVSTAATIRATIRGSHRSRDIADATSSARTQTKVFPSSSRRSVVLARARFCERRASASPTSTAREGDERTPAIAAFHIRYMGYNYT